MIEPLTLLLSALLAAQAQPSDSTNETASEKEATLAAEDDKTTDDDNKIICRRTAVIGSKFKKKICGTKKQWETLANRSASTTQEMQRRGKGLEPVN